MKIGNQNIMDSVFVIAEIGNNHEGSIDLAEDLVGIAAEAGADAVKFQTYSTELFISSNDMERFERMQRFELSRDAFIKLSRQARNMGLAFISTPFDLESVDFLDDIVDSIKIASGDNTFPQLIARAAKTKKPLILSTGLADFEDIRMATEIIASARKSSNNDINLALLHCVSSYPTQVSEANLAAISTLARNFPDCVTGYSDHTIGINAVLAAVAAGARVIEKHFTIDNHYSDFRDHSLSADPDTLKEMVQRIKEVSQMMGSGSLSLAECERTGEQGFRRSAYAARKIEPEEVISEQNIIWMRPAGGIPPAQAKHVIGLKTMSAVAKGQVIDPDSLK